MSNVELPPPAGWHTEDHLTDKSATTYSPAVRDRWLAKGWPVWPLYTADQVRANVEASTEPLLAEIERLAETLLVARGRMLGQVKWVACDCGCERNKPADAVSATWLRASALLRDREGEK